MTVARKQVAVVCTFVNAVFFSVPTPYGFDMINIKSIRNTRNFAAAAELNWKIWPQLYDLVPFYFCLKKSFSYSELKFNQNAFPASCF